MGESPRWGAHLLVHHAHTLWTPRTALAPGPCCSWMTRWSPGAQALRCSTLRTPRRGSRLPLRRRPRPDTASLGQRQWPAAPRCKHSSPFTSITPRCKPKSRTTSSSGWVCCWSRFDAACTSVGYRADGWCDPSQVRSSRRWATSGQ